jgi:phage tail-like protein
MTQPDPLSPLHVFRFDVTFTEDQLDPQQAATDGTEVALCRGAFSEVTGLEATMEPAVIREGGRNYGDLQRAGRVTFGTVILRRGITTTRDLWKWWELVQGGGYGYRLKTTIRLRDAALRAGAPSEAAVRGNDVTPSRAWVLRRCLPVKIKAPDLNAMAAEVGIEELHLVHEGLDVERPPAPSGGGGG